MAESNGVATAEEIPWEQGVGRGGAERLRSPTVRPSRAASWPATAHARSAVSMGYPDSRDPSPATSATSTMVRAATREPRGRRRPGAGVRRRLRRPRRRGAVLPLERRLSARGAVRVLGRQRLPHGLRRRRRLPPRCFSMVHCGAVCGDGCEHACHDMNDCTSSCGDDCALDCHNVVSWGAICGDRCNYRCASADRCDVRAGDGSSVPCTSITTCAVECLGRCHVACADVNNCDVKCLGAGAPPSSCGNGMTACGPC
jgi:hypothetical protein